MQPEQPERSKSAHWINIRALLMLVAAGLACVAILQHFQKTPTTPSVTAKKQLPARLGPAWHLRVADFPAQKAFIGFKYAGKVYMDASRFCVQPDFRTHADNEGLIKVKDRPDGGLLVNTPDITLPRQLTHKIWAVVSNQSPEHHIFDTPYQWLSLAFAPSSGACLFLGRKKEATGPQEFSTDTSEPVIGLMGLDAPEDLRLVPHGNAIEVTNEKRAADFVEFPWLTSWLKGLNGEKTGQCESSRESLPTSLVLPVKAQVISGNPQSAYWMVSSGCETRDHWALVITSADGVTSFARLSRPRSTYDYWPTKVWTVDIDGDGTLEFLVRAQYYEGAKYVLLRLSTDEKFGYQLTEIADTAYDGL